MVMTTTTTKNSDCISSSGSSYNNNAATNSSDRCIRDIEHAAGRYCVLAFGSQCGVVSLAAADQLQQHRSWQIELHLHRAQAKYMVGA